MYIITKKGAFIAAAGKIACLLTAISFILTLVGLLGYCYERNRCDKLSTPYRVQVDTYVFPNGRIVRYEWRPSHVDDETVAKITHSTEIIQTYEKLATYSATSAIGMLIITIILKSIKVPLQMVSPD